MDTTARLVGILENVVSHFRQIDSHFEAQDATISELRKQLERIEKNTFTNPPKNIVRRAKTMADDVTDLAGTLRILTGRRDAMIKKMAKHGISTREIAEVAGISKTQIHRLTMDHAAPAPTGKKPKASPHGR